MSKYFDTYKNFPKKGIIFKDYMKCFRDGSYVELIKNNFDGIDYIAPIEARGFLMAGAFWGLPIIPIRKKGKLPGKTISQKYKLEYGTAELEMQKINLKGKTVLILDDVLATGGTIKAAASLLRKCGARVVWAYVLEDIGICKEDIVDCLFVATSKCK